MLMKKFGNQISRKRFKHAVLINFGDQMATVATMPVVPTAKPIKPAQVTAAREEFDKLKRNLNEIPSWGLASTEAMEFMFSDAAVKSATEANANAVYKAVEK